MTAYDWVKSEEGLEVPEEWYCATRDVADVRLSRIYGDVLRGGWSDQLAALLVAVVGEISANCFDHNLGRWKDVMGCWLEWGIENGGGVSVVVADRGQGYLSSLREVVDIDSDAGALKVAFTQEISGRAPERRGRGLKYSLARLNDEFSGAFLKVCTGKACFSSETPLGVEQFDSFATNSDKKVVGVYIEIKFRKHES